MNVLFTFLGRPPRDADGYRPATYRFADGHTTNPVAFLGREIAQRTQPGRLVVLGTAGSAWDHLFESDVQLGAQADDDLLELMEAVEARAVTQSQLECLAPALSRALHTEVRLVLIPYCRTQPEQAALLGHFAEHVTAGDHIDIDVTHGFRTLPMLGLMAALYLRRVRSATVGHIWYGEFDPESASGTVNDLAGLLGFADWLDALAVFDATGDYAGFAPLMGSAGQLLADASFHERTTNPTLARQKLTAWTSQTANSEPENPAAALFADTLDERLAWRTAPDRAEWEARLARTALDNGDFLRAAIFAIESLITREVVSAKRNPDVYATREAVRAQIREHYEGAEKLGWLRNALAHGSRDQKVETDLASQAALRKELRRLFKLLQLD